jgi:hypothetical protein
LEKIVTGIVDEISDPRSTYGTMIVKLVSFLVEYETEVSGLETSCPFTLNVAPTEFTVEDIGKFEIRRKMKSPPTDGLSKQNKTESLSKRWNERQAKLVRMNISNRQQSMIKDDTVCNEIS